MRRVFTTTFAALALVMAAGVPAYADPGDGSGKGKGDPPAHASGRGNSDDNGGGDRNDHGEGHGGGSDGSPNGANGTVKIHDWPDHKNSAEMANDPKVCEFEIHGFNFDGGESENWWIQEHKWGGGDRSKAVLTGSYAANGDGDWTSGPHDLADGHYKLFVEMEHGTFKHKVFKVDCAEVGNEEGNEEGAEEEGSEGDIERQRQQANAVAGVQQPPTTGGVSPTVDRAAQPAQVGGQQAAPVTSLPSTSTDR